MTCLEQWTGCLENLNESGIQMKEEVDAHNHSKMDTVAEKIDVTNRKQAVVDSRVQMSLGGKWKNRN